MNERIYDGAFPRLRELLETRAQDEYTDLVRECRRNVEYHLDTMIKFSRSVSPGPLPWGQSMGRPDEIFVEFDFGKVVDGGDTAIRAGASVIDMSLVLVNAVIQGGLEVENVKWPRNNTANKLRKRMIEQGYERLAIAVDEIYASKGHELLKEYRNWVTHRGAPVLRPVSGSPYCVRLPPNIHAAEDRQWAIESYLLTEFPKMFSIWCKEFVPSIHGEVHEENTKLSVHSRIQRGSLMSSAEAYRSANPISVDLGQRQHAGQRLHEYHMKDYVMGINQIRRFVQEILTSALDVELAAVVSQR